MLGIYQWPSSSGHSSEPQNGTWNGLSICVSYAFNGLLGKEDDEGPRSGVSNKTSLVPTSFLWVNQWNKDSTLQFLWGLDLHLFVFNPSFGTKEGVRAGHAQVHSQDWAAWLSPGCHGSAALVWWYLPIFAEVSSPSVVFYHNCKGVIGLGVLELFFTISSLAHPSEIKWTRISKWRKETSFTSLIELNSDLLLEIDTGCFS